MANDNDLKKGNLPSVVYGIFTETSMHVVTDWGFFYNEDIAEVELSRLRATYSDLDFVLKEFIVLDCYK